MTPRRVLVVVEGPHDEALTAAVAKETHGVHVVSRKANVDEYWHRIIPEKFPSNPEGDIVRRVQVPGFYAWDGGSLAIVRADGDRNLVCAVDDTYQLLPNPPDAVAIVADADDSPAEARHKRLANELASVGMRAERSNYGAPLPTCSVFVLPNDRDDGTLEKLLIAAARISYPAALAAAEDYVAKAESLDLSSEDLREFRKKAGREKATVASIAAILKPCKAVQNSIRENRWLTPETLQDGLLRPFREFVAALLG